MGEAGDIFLPVAAMHADGVELHDLARVVFIQLPAEAVLLVEIQEILEARDAGVAEGPVLLPLGEGAGLGHPCGEMILREHHEARPQRIPRGEQLGDRAAADLIVAGFRKPGGGERLDEPVMRAAPRRGGLSGQPGFLAMSQDCCQRRLIQAISERGGQPHGARPRKC